jgi:flavin reductase (DIM6/NTAB) family NADH-FMN oxidoreductase RutF
MTSTTTRFDQKQLRKTLGAFSTGITVVTTRSNKGTLHGVTANSFSSVSLDPPLVLWSQSLTSSNFQAFSDSDYFVINILAADQKELSDHFGKSQNDKFKGIKFEEGIGGSPVLENTSAAFECKKIASYPGGDHIIYLGEINSLSCTDVEPLIFSNGKYLNAKLSN